MIYRVGRCKKAGSYSVNHHPYIPMNAHQGTQELSEQEPLPEKYLSECLDSSYLEDNISIDSRVSAKLV